nr:DUF3416 domain-containing protein [Cytophagales bacterium]
MKEIEGKKRATIDNVLPQINCGKYPIKRVINEPVRITADIFVDGHDKLKAAVLFREVRSGTSGQWKEYPMQLITNDNWEAYIHAREIGNYEFTIAAWVDHFSTWQYGLKKKYEDNQDIAIELLIGAEQIENTLSNPSISGAHKKSLQQALAVLDANENEEKTVAYMLSDELSDLMALLNDKEKVTIYPKNLPLKVELKLALFSAWYEFFPRSAAQEEGKHGTFADCERVLPEIAKMGFDVVYLPPIHPIGEMHRKGRNNATVAGSGDPGSPWAIGSKEGGHKAIHPKLGNFSDFNGLVKKAESLNLKIALDFAIQCAPDHPYVKEHPDWFTWRPDGTVQYAENPPKKYQDVLPVNFETNDWENLWKELKSIVDFWIDKGIKIFRVDNPHTKPFSFWEWLIREIHSKNPDIIFLAEAFTRPRIMEKLAKVGFNQSYTYFTWRTTKEELQEYVTELTQTAKREYFRPNFWPNTPDILPSTLEDKEEPSFLISLILAASLSSNFGIYGPVFEFGLNEAYPGKEEYIDSEKYEIKVWEWEKKTKIKEIITRLNEIRKENTAFQSTYNITFCEIENPNIICFSKIDDENDNRFLIAVNLDPHHSHHGWVKVPLAAYGLKSGEKFIVHDLLSNEKYTWDQEWNYVELNPYKMPAHLFRVETA